MKLPTKKNIVRIGVRQRMIIVLVLVLTIALGVSGWMALKQQQESVIRELNQRGKDISKFVAKSVSYGVVGYDYHTIQLLIDEIVATDDVIYAKVENAKGNTMGESGVSANADTFIYFEDIIFDNNVVGYLTIALSTDRAHKTLVAQRFTLIEREAIIIVLIALGEFMALSLIIVRPVTIISKYFSQGMLENGRIVSELPIDSGDEFGELARHFNSMRDQLNETNMRLQSKIELSDQRLLDTNNQLLQQASEFQRVNDELKRLSITDPLTGLYNRRHFEKLAETELAVALRRGEVNSLMVIDIDYFKRINDRLGHKAGDIVLKAIADILKKGLRRVDMLCRIGGEEFVAFCKRTDIEQVIFVAEKLRKTIEASHVDIGTERISVTVSIGAATVGHDHPVASVDEFFKRADMALYYSKDTGRNRVTHYDAMVCDVRRRDRVIRKDIQARVESAEMEAVDDSSN